MGQEAISSRRCVDKTTESHLWTTMQSWPCPARTGYIARLRASGGTKMPHKLSHVSGLPSKKNLTKKRRICMRVSNPNYDWIFNVFFENSVILQDSWEPKHHCLNSSKAFSSFVSKDRPGNKFMSHMVKSADAQNSFPTPRAHVCARSVLTLEGLSKPGTFMSKDRFLFQGCGSPTGDQSFRQPSRPNCHHS